MPTRIAHLSDLHYGGAFDLDTWNSVASAVAGFRPHLLIVSGDLVDDPSEAQLRAVKQKLDDLAATAGAELFVVPGNHDVSPFGIDLWGARSGLFHEIFRGTDPQQSADGALEKGGGLWKVSVARVKAWLDFALRAVPRPGWKTSTSLREARQASVLVALIDSNAPDQKIGLATGSVRKLVWQRARSAGKTSWNSTINS